MTLHVLALLPVALIGISSGLQLILPVSKKLYTRPTHVQPIFPSSKLYTGQTQGQPILFPSPLYSSVTPVNELQRLEMYILEFMGKTNNGRVLTTDISEFNIRTGNFFKKLTNAEKEARETWAAIRKELQKHYSAIRMLKDITVEEMLQLLVAPPLLNTRTISWRTKFSETRNALHIGKMYAWDNFENEVRSFTVTAVKENETTADVLYHSLEDDRSLTDECDEGCYIKSHVLQQLQNACLLEHRAPPDAKAALLPGRPRLGRGSADHFLIVDGSTTVPIEFKSTQNLLLPPDAARVADRYNKAVQEVIPTQNRIIDLANIGRPLGQLMYYMVAGGSRYGVLSSATRTYFFKVEETGNDPRVLITEAWFIGEKDYLRAWSYLYHLATGNGDFMYPESLSNQTKKVRMKV